MFSGDVNCHRRVYAHEDDHFLFDTMSKLVIDEIVGGSTVRGHAEVNRAIVLKLFDDAAMNE